MARRYIATAAIMLAIAQLAAQTDINRLSGKFNPETMGGFKPVPAKYILGGKQVLDERTLTAFLKLAAAAEKAGFNIRIVSGTRNFGTQKVIWEQKFNGIRKVAGQNLAKTMPDHDKRALEILRFSSMPGTSRHHWGTDMDFHEAKMTAPALTNSSFKSGRGLEFHTWLTANASALGFCQPYTGDPALRNGTRFVHGYQEERWHWSYKPVSRTLMQAFEAQAKSLTPAGFAGDGAGAKYFMDYVFNIDSSCL